MEHQDGSLVAVWMLVSPGLQSAFIVNASIKPALGRHDLRHTKLRLRGGSI